MVGASRLEVCYIFTCFHTVRTVRRACIELTTSITKRQGPQCIEGLLSSKRCLKCLKGIVPFDPNSHSFLDKETDVQRD
ncbi:hypothetical protein ACRRTK_019471 [Alexandromys fortis]